MACWRKANRPQASKGNSPKTSSRTSVAWKHDLNRRPETAQGRRWAKRVEYEQRKSSASADQRHASAQRRRRRAVAVLIMARRLKANNYAESPYDQPPTISYAIGIGADPAMRQHRPTIHRPARLDGQAQRIAEAWHDIRPRDPPIRNVATSTASNDHDEYPAPGLAYQSSPWPPPTNQPN